MKAKSKKKEQKPYHYTGCGLDNVFLYGGIREIESARGKLVQIEDLKGLHREIGRSLVQETKNLDGKEFRFLRHEINITQEHLAGLLGVDVQSVGRWEREEGDRIPGPAQAVVRLLYDEKFNGNKAISESLERLRELDEQFGEDEDIRLMNTPEGWSTAA